VSPERERIEPRESPACAKQWIEERFADSETADLIQQEPDVDTAFGRSHEAIEKFSTDFVVAPDEELDVDVMFRPGDLLA